MDKDNRKYRICFIDYMWYVAEIWHEREHNKGYSVNVPLSNKLREQFYFT